MSIHRGPLWAVGRSSPRPTDSRVGPVQLVGPGGAPHRPRPSPCASKMSLSLSLSLSLSSFLSIPSSPSLPPVCVYLTRVNSITRLGRPTLTRQDRARGDVRADPSQQCPARGPGPPTTHTRPVRPHIPAHNTPRARFPALRSMHTPGPARLDAAASSDLREPTLHCRQ
jgi:hypothetical protein